MVSYPTVTYDNTGRILSIVGVLHPSYTGGCWGTSYDYGSGSTAQRNGYCALMKKDTPTMAGWLGNFAVPGTTQPTIALSVLANATPNAVYPSTWYIGHGENDYTACPGGTTACQNLFSRAAMAGIYWAAVAPQQRTLGTNMTKSGAWVANTTLAPVNAITGNVAGSAIQSVTSGDTLTITVPATNNGSVQLFVYAPTGTTGGSFTLVNSTTGTSYTDSCNSDSTTFNAYGCNGTGAWAAGPWALRFATLAGVVNTITLTHTNATALTVIAHSYTTSTPAANTNAVIARTAGAAYDTSGWTATALAAVVAQARADGLMSVLLSDARAAIASVADGSATDGVSQTDSPIFGPGSTQTNHPRNYAHLMMEQAALQAEVANNYVVSVVGAGWPDPENVADTRRLTWQTPFNPTGATTWAAMYRDLNADSNYTTFGLKKYGGVTAGAFLERIGSGPYPDGGSGAYHASVVPSSGRECVQKFTTANVVTESNFSNVVCADANGNTTQSGYSMASYVVRPVGTAIASAATIAPSAGVTHVTGTAAITTITAPAGCVLTGKGCDVTFLPDGAWTLATGGNIAQASTAVVNRPMVLTWVNADAKWYPSY